MMKIINYFIFSSPWLIWANSITITPDTLYVTMETGEMSVEQVTIHNDNSFQVNLDVSILGQFSQNLSFFESENRYKPDAYDLLRNIQPDVQYMDPAGNWVEGVRCGTPPTDEMDLINIQSDLNRTHVSRSQNRSLVNILVAWHVINSTSGAGNIPESMIMDQMDVLNAAYQPYDIFFTLEVVDYTVNDSWFNDMEQYENAYKQQLNIDPIHYLNIYSGNMPGLLGWSYLPYQWPEGDYMNGVCLLYSSLPGGTAYPFNAGDTGTHEVGHYVGLLHTFESGCSVNNDYVNDTPQENNGNNIYNCNNTDTCPNDPGMDPIHNFMTYTDDACLNEFSPGQGNRMSTMIATYRPGLLENPVSPDWVTVNETSIAVPANGSYDLAFTFYGSDLMGGDYGANIFFEETAMDTVLTLPSVLHIQGVTGLTLNFETMSDTLYQNEFSNHYLEMTYSGTEQMVYQFDYDLSWVTVLGGDGTLDNGETQYITFNLNSLFMEQGDYDGVVNLTTNMGSLQIGVHMVVLEALDVIDGMKPVTFTVSPNYPNPFNPSTNITVSLPERTFVNVSIYDLKGRRVSTLLNSMLEHGKYEVTWEGKNEYGLTVSAGVYILKVDARQYHHTQKLIYNK